MKLKNRLFTMYLYVFMAFLIIAIVVTIPLQFLDFILFGKNRIAYYLSDEIYKNFDKIDDLKKLI